MVISRSTSSGCYPFRSDCVQAPGIPVIPFLEGSWSLERARASGSAGRSASSSDAPHTPRVHRRAAPPARGVRGPRTGDRSRIGRGGIGGRDHAAAAMRSHWCRCSTGSVSRDRSSTAYSRHAFRATWVRAVFAHLPGKPDNRRAGEHRAVRVCACSAPPGVKVADHNESADAEEDWFGIWRDR